MILLPSDPLYEVVMADQAEENQSNVLADAFRTKIYNLYDQSMPQSANVFADRLSPNGDICYAIGDFAHFNQIICPDAFYDSSGEGTADSYGKAAGLYSDNNIEDDDV